MTDDSRAATLVRIADARPSLLARLRAAMHLRRQRRALAAMDERMLRDIGLTPQQALSEAARPFWDVPSNWRL